jgi:multidrug transporter EmrE-like cation transporter
VNSSRTASRKIAWGPLIVVAIGGALFLLGAGRFLHQQRFGLVDALFCGLAIAAGWVLLLVFDYVLHHARLVSIMVLVLGVVLVSRSPAFDVGLGVALMGAIIVPALGERKQRLVEAATADGEGKRPN